MKTRTWFFFSGCRAAAAQAGRLLLASALAVGASVWPKSVAGGSPVSLETLRLPAGSLQELLADRLWLHGMLAQVLVFDTPSSVPDLIKFLSEQQPALSDLNVLAGHAILSGQVGHEQWVVQMEGLGPRRTVGSVSSLAIRTSAKPPSPPWLPAGGRLRLDIAAMDQGVKVSQRIWQYALPPERMVARLEAGLRRDGWQRLPGDEPAQWWIKRGARLRASLVALDAGSGLLVSGWAP